MSTSNILLIIISGLGVVHGLFLAIFLWIYQRGDHKSNKILSLLLIVLSFRVGKSIIMEFAEIIDIKLIFIGLATLMVIGPLFYFYTLSSVNKTFRFREEYLIHFIPALIGVCFGFWVDDGVFESIPKLYILLMFVTYYGHYLTYLFISRSYLSRKKTADLNPKTYALLCLLFYGLFVIWLAYVLNLFDEFVPYIAGPILYTLVAYAVSFVIFQKGYLHAASHIKYKTTPISDEQSDTLFTKVLKLVIDEKQFKNPELTLKLLSEKLNVSTQILSMVINKQSNTNFNSFINHHRIEESIKMFQNEQHDNYTISAIGFEVGFNSISSFNAAFKKQIGETPLAFRKKMSK